MSPLLALVWEQGGGGPSPDGPRTGLKTRGGTGAHGEDVRDSGWGLQVQLWVEDGLACASATRMARPELQLGALFLVIGWG